MCLGMNYELNGLLVYVFGCPLLQIASLLMYLMCNGFWMADIRFYFCCGLVTSSGNSLVTLSF